MYIYHAKRSRILYEWYLSPWSGMEGFITEGPITNKEINQKIVVMSGHWEFGVFEPKGLPRVSRVHGTPEADFQLEVTRLKAQITSITKEKEELSDLLEDTSRAKMMCETDLHRLQENWEKENEEFHINIFNQLKNDLLARDE
uniref:Uncharacterized protein n=1 Tax=Vitis vinifera TaxID=29760 RepID=A5B105_VITVI|nr:hypothetical protein VITISV_024621 [Vitis vinifera]